MFATQPNSPKNMTRLGKEKCNIVDEKVPMMEKHCVKRRVDKLLLTGRGGFHEIICG